MKKIRTRAIISVLIPILSYTVGGTILYFSLQAMLAHAQELYEEDYLAMNALIEADRDAYQSRLALLNAISLVNPEFSQGQENYLADIRDNRDQVLQRFTIFQDRSDLSSDFPQIQTFHKYYTIWSQETDNVIKLFTSDNFADARQAYTAGTYATSFNTFRDAMDKLTEYSLKEAEVNYKLIRSSAWKVHGVFIATSVIVLAALFMLVAVIIRTILAPLKQTTQIMRDISSGEADLTKRLSITREDEIGELAQFFDSFLDSIFRIVREVVDVSRETSRIKDQTAAQVAQSTAAVEEIAANIATIFSRAHVLDDSTETTRSSVQTISQGIQELKYRGTAQATAVEESTAAVVQMTASIQTIADVASRRLSALTDLDAAIRDGAGAVDSTISIINKISNSISSIREITDVIASVSAQTNLLAMNAAIEAAHAGDAGRGFGVVASEIRKLAESTNAQSNSISDLLNNIIGEIEAVDAAGQKTGNAFKGVTSQTDSLKTALQEISRGMDELRTGGTQINEAMTDIRDTTLALTEQTETIDSERGRISEATNTVRRLSTEITGGLNEIHVGATEINQAMDELNNSAATLAELIGRLDGQVGRLIA